MSQLVNQQDTLAKNIANVRTTIIRAAEQAGRNPEEITLIAVSKTQPIELIHIAYHLGITDFGENRVQEASHKIADFHPQGLCWHMIGHLQSNKAGKAATVFDSIQSVDSLHLAQTLNHHAAKRTQRLPILLQVNIANEESKEGVSAVEAATLARQIVALPYLELQGLMTIAPLVNEPEEVRPVFRTLRVLRDKL